MNIIMTDSEYFEIRVGVEDRALPVSDVIALLDGFQNMAVSLNKSLNKVYTCGFDEVSIEVVGFEQGSLRIPICIKKVFSQFVSPIGKDVIAGLILWYFTSGSDSIKLQTPNEEVTVERTEIAKSRSICDSVNKIASTVVNSDKITNLSMKYTDGNDREVSVTVDKEQMARAVVDIDETSSYVNIPNVILQIVSPTLEAKSVQWKVRYDRKVRPMKMNDLGFLELVDARDIAFSKGDVLKCDIQIIEKEDTDGTIKRKYVITKVHSFPHYRRLNNAEEGQLFEGN